MCFHCRSGNRALQLQYEGEAETAHFQHGASRRAGVAARFMRHPAGHGSCDYFPAGEMGQQRKGRHHLRNPGRIRRQGGHLRMAGHTLCRAACGRTALAAACSPGSMERRALRSGFRRKGGSTLCAQHASDRFGGLPLPQRLAPRHRGVGSARLCVDSRRQQHLGIGGHRQGILRPVSRLARERRLRIHQLSARHLRLVRAHPP